MSSYYRLQVIRLNDLQWERRCCMLKLYVEVKLGGVSRKKKIKKDTISPIWDKPLLFSCDPAGQSATFTIQVNRSILLKNTCIGIVDITPSELLRKCDQGEASLDLSPPDSEGMTPIGRIVVQLSIVDVTERASTSLDKAKEDVQQSRIAHADGTLDVMQVIDNSVSRATAQKDLYLVIKELVSRINAVAGVIDQLSETHPFLKVASKLVTGLCSAAKSVFGTDERVIDLVNAMVDAFAFSCDVQRISSVRKDGLERLVTVLMKQTIECCLFVRHYLSCTFFRHTLDTSSSQKVDEFERSLADLKQRIESNIILNTTFVSMRSSERIDGLVLRQMLNPVLSYLYDRPVCLAGTRVEVRSQIIEWVFSETGQNVFWLHGFAGSGKSTIATTIVGQLHEMSRLGAFLFFEREKSDPSSVIRSIAYQLAVFDASIGSAILSEIDKDPLISMASLSHQFDMLIRRPLSNATNSVPGPIVIALDAFDECGTSSTRSSLMELIQEEFPKLPPTFRIMITSRREADIDSFLSKQPQNVVAMELDHDSQTSRGDVLTYIKSGMKTAMEESPVAVKVLEDWPWNENMDLLGSAAGGLFIWASTAVKVVKNSDNPFRQLECLISDSKALAGSDIDRLYAAVLRGSGINWESSASKERFQKVLSMLLFSKVPLTPDAIDKLLGFPRQESSLYILSRLRSVLSFFESGPINLYHASFADYLVSPKCREEPWFIDPSVARRHIIDGCFLVTKDLLRFNICDVESSFIRNDDDPDLAGRVVANIPLHLEYACLYWPQHLTGVEYSAGLAEELSRFAYEHLLFWFEVLSLKRQFGRVAVRALVEVASWVKENDAYLSSFLREASRLARLFARPIMDSVPHIYISMIPLSQAQDESVVSAHYAKCLRSMVRVERRGVKRPAACLKVLKGHSKVVRSISVSSDGRRIASASYDGTIRIWDFDSGEETLEPCIERLGGFQSVSFFPDDWKRIVSGGRDGTVAIWNAENGNLLLDPLKHHSGPVIAITVSPDGSAVASGSARGTIIIWDALNGRIQSQLTGHSSRINSVSFSPDGTQLASCSNDKTVRIWNVNNGQLALAPINNDGRVISVSFSPDGEHVASASGEKVTIQDSKMGNLIQVLQGHTPIVISVAYSPCGTQIVSGSLDGSICIWNAVTGEIVSRLDGHSGYVNCITFSPDGNHIVSGSFDGTIRIWDAKASTATTAGMQIRHTGRLASVAISADGSLIASASRDGSIVFWDAESGDIAAVPPLNLGFLGFESVTHVAFTPDLSQLITAENGTIRIWDMSMGGFRLLGGIQDISRIAVSPDGTMVVSGFSDGTIQVWDIATGVVIAGPLVGHSLPISSVAFSPDGNLLASGSSSRNGTIIIRSTENWTVIVKWDTEVSCICFSPDSSLLAYVVGDGVRARGLLFRNILNGQDICGAFTEHIFTILFLPDGLHVVSYDQDNLIQVWNRESGQTICVLRGDSFPINYLSSSRDGTRLVSGSLDGTIRVWDISDLGKHGKGDMDASGSLTREDVLDWKLDDDGWLQLPYHERRERVSAWELDDDGWPQPPLALNRGVRVLLWIPHDLRQTLLSSRNTLDLRRDSSSKINFTDAVLGERWSECFIQPTKD